MPLQASCLDDISSNDIVLISTIARIYTIVGGGLVAHKTTGCLGSIKTDVIHTKKDISS